jgi:hypothetical protein
MTVSDPMRAKALTILREGRLSVCRATDNEAHEPQRVMALVTSSRPGVGRYAVEMSAGGQSWSCTCRDGMQDLPCAHVAALRLVTVGVAA